MTEPTRPSSDPVEDDDLPIFLAHQDDPVAAAMAAFPTRAPDVFYAHWATIRADPTNYTRTIVADDEVVGDIVSWLDDGSARSATGSVVSTGGRGSRRPPSGCCSTRSTDRPIMAHIVPANIGSQRVVEKCGFVRVGEEVADDGVHELIFRLD